MEPAKLREALRKQGIYVHESDPILEIGAICELAVADTVKAIEGLNKAAADRISAASSQHIEAARQSAAALITEAGTMVGRTAPRGGGRNLRVHPEGAAPGGDES